MRLHIFNPDHDEALAAATPYYTPRRAARLLADGLAALPAWWAAGGDAVLAPAGAPCPPPLPPGVRFVRPDALTDAFWAGVAAVEPWGWDAALCHRLRRCGCPERLLPGGERLAEWRALSSRLTAVRMLRHLQETMDGVQTFRSRWCMSREGLAEAVGAYGEAMVKAPWSSSGRGVFRLGADAEPRAWQRAWRTLDEQGGLEVEPFYKRLADFAAEFEVGADGSVTYAGLSLFSATASGAYTGNVVAPQSVLLERLLSHAGTLAPGGAAAVHRALTLAVDHLVRLLPGLVGSYTGPLGVDMMLVGLADGAVALHPCVEINVRRTMGWVALQLWPHLAGCAPEGRFVVQAGGQRGTGVAEILPLSGGADGCRAAIVR